MDRIPFFLQLALWCIAPGWSLGPVLWAQDLRLDSTVRFDYLSGDTIPSLKEQFFYDSKGMQIGLITQNWPFSLQTWNDQSRVTTSYNGSLPDTVTHWIAGVSGAWLQKNRFVKDYDNDFLLREDLEQTFDTINQQWVNSTRIKQGRSIENHRYQVRASWNNFTKMWITVDSTDFAFEGELVVADTTYTFIPFVGVFLNSGRSEYLYNSNGALLEKVRYRFDARENQFLPSSRDVFDYDDSGSQILSQFDIWEDTAWVASLRIDRTFRDDGYLLESRLFFQDFIENELVPVSVVQLNYLTGVQSDTLISSIKNLVFMGPVLVPDWITHYYYSSGSTTSSSEPDFPDIRIFPNPFIDHIQLQGETDNIHYYFWISTDGRVLDSGPVIGKVIHGPVLPATAQAVILTLWDKKRRFIYSTILRKGL